MMLCCVLRVVLKMVGEMQSCTAVMHLVPTPMTFGNPYSQLAQGYLQKNIGYLTGQFTRLFELRKGYDFRL